jgi:hypothetical protein
MKSIEWTTKKNSNSRQRRGDKFTFQVDFKTARVLAGDYQSLSPSSNSFRNDNTPFFVSAKGSGFDTHYNSFLLSSGISVRGSSSSNATQQEPMASIKKIPATTINQRIITSSIRDNPYSRIPALNPTPRAVVPRIIAMIPRIIPTTTRHIPSSISLIGI